MHIVDKPTLLACLICVGIEEVLGSLALIVWSLCRGACAIVAFVFRPVRRR